MNKWSRNSIYGAGLASLLYLGCGNSVQNKDIKVQEDIDLGLADRNLDDFYQPVDSSLEDRINPIDSRELDYISIEDSSLETQRESDILPDSLEYDNNLDPSLNDLSRDDYSIDLGSDHVNGDAGLDDYVSSDLDYCSSLEINSLEWCENCNTAPVLENAYLRDPKPSYAIGEDIYVCVEASDPDSNLYECRIFGASSSKSTNCTSIDCTWLDFFVEGQGEIYAIVEDRCKTLSEIETILVYIENQ